MSGRTCRSLAGILYYLLSGKHPYILEDAEGRLPHQRDEPLAILQGVCRRPVATTAVGVRQGVCAAHRGPVRRAADEMLTSMEKVMAPPGRPGTEASRLEAIREAMEHGGSSTHGGDTPPDWSRLMRHIARVFNDVTTKARAERDTHFP